MIDNSPQNRLPASSATHSWRLWILFVFVAVVGGGAFLVARWPGKANPGPENNPSKPLDGELFVLVKPPGRSTESVRVEEENALPVRHGGSMSLEVHFNQPACAYLIWLNAEGQPVPLYPWNYDKLTVTDVDQPPPVRKATDVIFSPPLGSSWKFGKSGGLETVLLLARRTPLPEGTRLGSLIEPLPAVKAHSSTEAAVLGLTQSNEPIASIHSSNRGSDERVQAADEALRKQMIRLREHFELIRAVRFAHESSDSKE